MTIIAYRRDTHTAQITARGHQDDQAMCAGISAMMCALLNGLDDGDLTDGQTDDGYMTLTMRRTPRADAMFDMTVRGFKAMREQYGDNLRVVKAD